MSFSGRSDTNPIYLLMFIGRTGSMKSTEAALTTKEESKHIRTKCGTGFRFDRSDLRCMWRDLRKTFDCFDVYYAWHIQSSSCRCAKRIFRIRRKEKSPVKRGISFSGKALPATGYAQVRFRLTCQPCNYYLQPINGFRGSNKLIWSLYLSLFNCSAIYVFIAFVFFPTVST